jgi:hypothetical protein
LDRPLIKWAYGLTLVHSVEDPKLFITDPDPEPSSYGSVPDPAKVPDPYGSGSGSPTLLLHVEVRFVPKFDTLVGKKFFGGNPLVQLLNQLDQWIAADFRHTLVKFSNEVTHTKF